MLSTLILLSTNSIQVYEALMLLSFVILAGMIAGRFSESLGLPAITGYIIAGVIIGFILVLFNLDILSADLAVISQIGLGFVAYSIGKELIVSKLKKSGKEVVVITVIQTLSTVILTFVGFYGAILIGLNISFSVALVLAAIATATAPAPIMMIVKKNKSEGPITNVLLPLVGIDDATGIIVFGVALSIAEALHTSGSITLLTMLGPSFLEIFFSLLIGAVFGYVLVFTEKGAEFKDSNFKFFQLNLTLFAIFMCVAISAIGIHIGFFSVHLSPILTPMFAGFVFSNKAPEKYIHTNDNSLEYIQAPLLTAFFTLSGIELVVRFFSEDSISLLLIIILVMIYIVFRSIGKFTGARLGANIMHSHPNVRKYLGLCLLPHAGVAIGMAYTAKTSLDSTDGITILIVVLVATLVFALLGPILVKRVLDKTGENKLKQDYVTSLHDVSIPE